MNKNDIVTFLSDNRKVLRDRYKVSRIGLFGSYAVNLQRDDSDIDLVVSMPSDFDLYYDLKEFLEMNFHKRVDLGLEKTIRELVRLSIKDEVIYV